MIRFRLTRPALAALTLTAAPALLAGCAATDAQTGDAAAKPETDPRARVLAELANLDERGQKIAEPYLKGREPGKPVQCISSNRIRRSTTASDGLFLYEESGGIVYANAPYGGCPGARNNAIITQRPTLRMCSGDIILVQDLIARAPLGSCAFSEFVPFTKPKGGGE